MHLLKPFYFSPWPSHLPTNWQTSCHTSWQLSHLPTPPYTSLIAITPLCQLTHLSNTFHTSLRTVTLPVIFHTFLVAILHPLLCSATVTLHWQLSQPSYYIFHTSLTTSQLSNNSHTSPSNFQTSHTLIIPTPLQLPKHIPHDSHLSNNIFVTTFTPSWELQTIS